MSHFPWLTFSRGQKRHINIWHINNFSVTPVTDPPGRVPDILPAGYPDENACIPWVPHTAHKLLTPGHRSGDPWPPGRETTPPPGQSPEKFVYVYMPFPFLILGTEKVPQRKCVTKILPNVRVNFLVRFASKPLFDWIMTGNLLELFRKFFGAVRAIFWLCGSFLAPNDFGLPRK